MHFQIKMGNSITQSQHSIKVEISNIDGLVRLATSKKNESYLIGKATLLTPLDEVEVTMAPTEDAFGDPSYEINSNIYPVPGKSLDTSLLQDEDFKGFRVHRSERTLFLYSSDIGNSMGIFVKGNPTTNAEGIDLQHVVENIKQLNGPRRIEGAIQAYANALEMLLNSIYYHVAQEIPDILAAPVETPEITITLKPSSIVVTELNPKAVVKPPIPLWIQQLYS